MKNFVQKGDTITVTAPYAVSAGGGALVGAIFGIAQNDALNGATDLELNLVGVYDLPKLAGQAETQGQKIYWDNTNKWVTNVATANVQIGYAIQAAAAGDATARVRLSPTPAAASL